MYIDTHCHLNSDELIENVEEIIAQSHAMHVDKFLVVGWDIESSRHAITLAHQYPEIYAIVGIHPCDIDSSSLEDLKPLLDDERVVALGEIGLDYHWVKDPLQRNKQKEYFKAQIALANAHHLPICIHSRDAIQDTYDILSESFPQYGCIMHCFSGSKEMMKRFLELGCYISFGGPVTFKNARESKECAYEVPLDKLLLETDCPYLAPHPYRGKTNNPSYLPLIGQEIARIKGLSEKEIAQNATSNAIKVFKL